jgi:ATP-binding cassette, subfamily C (CFTR/MRP), member 1
VLAYTNITSLVVWLNWWAAANEEQGSRDLGKWLGVLVALAIGSTIAASLGDWCVSSRIVDSAVVPILMILRQVLVTMINKSGQYFHEVLLNTTSR